MEFLQVVTFELFEFWKYGKRGKDSGRRSNSIDCSKYITFDSIITLPDRHN